VGLFGSGYATQTYMMIHLLLGVSEHRAKF